jgi:hypothetical protein
VRSFQKVLVVILLSIFTFSACNENISDTQPVSPVSPVSQVSNDENSLAKQPPAKFVNIARALDGDNGQGSIFLEPTISGFGIFIENDLEFELVELFPGFFINLVVGGQIAFFDAAFGRNDFWRENPDGSLSVKLNSSEAYAAVYDYDTGEYYEGTGHLNTKFTGTVEEICYDPCLPDPCGYEICYTQLFPDPSINTHVGTGRANVVDSQGGSHQMQIIFVQNPGGGGHMKFTLN